MCTLMSFSSSCRFLTLWCCFLIIVFCRLTMSISCFCRFYTICRFCNKMSFSISVVLKFLSFFKLSSFKRCFCYMPFFFLFFFFTFFLSISYKLQPKLLSTYINFKIKQLQTLITVTLLSQNTPTKLSIVTHSIP